MHYMVQEHIKLCRKPLGAKKLHLCTRKLAESIILQSIEDLWDRSRWTESVTFFTDKGFSICAGIAGMDIHAQVRLLDMVNKAIKSMRSAETNPNTGSGYGR